MTQVMTSAPLTAQRSPQLSNLGFPYKNGTAASISLHRLAWIKSLLESFVAIIQIHPDRSQNAAFIIIAYTSRTSIANSSIVA